MNTSMVELIKWINKNNTDDYPLESFDIVKKAIELLEKEKEQMIEMYYAGHTAPYFSQNGNDVEKQAEDYYNETYQ